MHKIITKVFLLFAPLSIFSNVSAIYLSWYDDPSTTMTIQWHTDLNMPEDTLQWKAGNQTDWQETKSTYHPLPSTQIHIHQTSLSQLTPDSEYEFKIGSDSTIYRFHTMPQTLHRPISFIVGGDLFSSRKIFRKMAQTICAHQPDFIVIGGNIARAINPNLFQLQSSSLRHWLSFFNEWKKAFVTSDHHIIPFLITPGEEDIQPNDYELFFTFFAFPKKELYRAVNFGNYLSLFLLDTGHFHPIEGPQSYWLKHALCENQLKHYRFAVYSDSAYPSFDPYQGSIAKKIRTTWCPLFDEYHLQAAFEHHNRAFKRTFPLYHNQIQQNGTVYLGDGCWGAEPRKTNDLWYLEKKAKHSGVWRVELTPEKASMTAIDLMDQPIDEICLQTSNN